MPLTTAKFGRMTTEGFMTRSDSTKEYERMTTEGPDDARRQNQQRYRYIYFAIFPEKKMRTHSGKYHDNTIIIFKAVHAEICQKRKVYLVLQWIRNHIESSHLSIEILLSSMLHSVNLAQLQGMWEQLGAIWRRTQGVFSYLCFTLNFAAFISFFE